LEAASVNLNLPNNFPLPLNIHIPPGPVANTI
jgi:hypothetical protein